MLNTWTVHKSVATHYDASASVLHLDILQHELDGVILGPRPGGTEALVDERGHDDLARARRILACKLDKVHDTLDAVFLCDSISIGHDLLEDIGVAQVWFESRVRVGSSRLEGLDERFVCADSCLPVLVREAVWDGEGAKVFFLRGRAVHLPSVVAVVV